MSFTEDITKAFARRVGRFEWAVLAAVKEFPERAYCAELSRILSEREGREVSMGQVSRTLGVLRDIGAITVERRYVDPPQKNQRHRMVHEITDVGKQVLHWLGKP